jgi:hypothetical protein
MINKNNKHKPKISKLDFDILDICETCNYDGGFHVLLQRLRKNPPANVLISFKCPNCGQIYELGLAISTTQNNT